MDIRCFPCEQKLTFANTPRGNAEAHRHASRHGSPLYYSDATGFAIGSDDEDAAIVAPPGIDTGHKLGPITYDEKLDVHYLLEKMTTLDLV